MERASRAPLRIASNVWPVALTTLAAIALAVAAARQDPGRAVHESVTTTLRAMDINHASLQRDVLRARSGLLPSYDPLVKSVVALRGLTEELDHVLSKPEFADGRRFAPLLAALRRETAKDETLVERFKTKNALLQNSIGVFGQALSDIYRSPDETGEAAIVRAGDLGNMMMRFSTKPDEALSSSIRASLKELPVSGARNVTLSDIETIKAHSYVILKVLPQVDTTIDAIQASRVPARVAAVQAAYTDVSATVDARAALSRLVLGATSVSLFMYIVVLVCRLQKQTDRLRQRLSFEQAIAEMRACMADMCPQHFAGFLDQCLERIAFVLEAESCGFAVVDGASGRVRESYGAIEREGAAIVDFAAGLVGQDGAPGGEGQPEMEGQEGTPRYSIVSEAGSATPTVLIGAALPERQAAILQVRHGGRQPRTEPHDLQLLQATLQTLAEFVETIHNREQRDTLKQRLQHAERLEAIGTLAGGIAHEFNNVLGAILGYGEMALQLLRRSSPTRHYVDEILKSGRRATHIVDQILTFSRKRERTIQPFDITEAIEDILPLLEVTLRQEIRYSVKRGVTSAVVEGNPIEIHQIAMNLCRNAVEASAKVGPVAITISAAEIRRRRILSHGELAPGRYVCMSVADEGPGISEQTLPHIFEPFFTTKSRSGGTGLGLSAVHGIVTQMGGGINVTSEIEVGTRFELFFPTSDLPPTPIGDFFDERSVPKGKGERVAIVEHDGTRREMYEEKVAALGYEPLGFATMHGLLNQRDGRDQNCPDLVIVGRTPPDRGKQPCDLDELLGKGRYLLLTEAGQPRGHDAQERSTLKVPFSSRSLAHAISAKLAASH